MKQFIARNPLFVIFPVIVVLALAAISIFWLPNVIQWNQEVDKSHAIERMVQTSDSNEDLSRALVDEKVDSFHKDAVFTGTEWNAFRNLNGKSADSDARAKIKQAYEQLDTLKADSGPYVNAKRSILVYRAYLDGGAVISDASEANFLVAVNTIKDACSAPDPAAEVAKWDMDSAKIKPVLGNDFELSLQNKAVVNKAFQKVMNVGVAQLCK